MIERYTRPRMKAVWDLAHKYEIWLEVELQACAAVGQSRLMAIYEKLFAEHQLHVAQVLLQALHRFEQQLEAVEGQEVREHGDEQVVRRHQRVEVEQAEGHANLLLASGAALARPVCTADTAGAMIRCGCATGAPLAGCC